MITKKHSLLTALLLLALLIFAAPATAAKTPIVFVHGYAGWGGNFDVMIWRFRNDGWQGNRMFKFSYNSLLRSNTHSAARLRDYVNHVRSQTGSHRVDIIAHSNGGLVTRYYRNKLGGHNHIKNFVTLGTPHRGTHTAWLCISPACTEMRPGSNFLNNLGGGCDYSIWSWCDEIINPSSNAQCGHSVQTSCQGHVMLLGTHNVYTLARNRIR